MKPRKLIIGRGAVPPKKERRPVASLPAFTWEQAAAIRSAKLTGCLVNGVPLPPPLDSLRPFRRRFERKDNDGKHVGWGIEHVTTHELVDGERCQVRWMLTIVDVSDRLYVLDPDALTLEHARLCGYTSVLGLRDAWRTLHPKTPVVRAVRFALGDVRDLAPMMRHTAGETLSPTHALDPDAPKVPPADQERYSKLGHARDDLRLRDPIRIKRDEAERVLGELYELLPSGNVARDRIRRLERELQHLNRELAA